MSPFMKPSSGKFSCTRWSLTRLSLLERRKLKWKAKFVSGSAYFSGQVQAREPSAADPGQPRVSLWPTGGQPEGNLGSTQGQPGVSMWSTRGRPRVSLGSTCTGLPCNCTCGSSRTATRCPPAPRRRVIENKQSTDVGACLTFRVNAHTHAQSRRRRRRRRRRRTEEEEEIHTDERRRMKFNVGQEHVLNNPQMREGGGGGGGGDSTSVECLFSITPLPCAAR